MAKPTPSPFEEELMTPMQEGVATLRENYLALRGAGFTLLEGCYIIALICARNSDTNPSGDSL